MSTRYVVAGRMPWNRRTFDGLSDLPGEWRFAEDREQLSQVLGTFQPKVAFFLHWSWMVPAGVVEEVECINFHMTDLPYGRGGSPLQNLIARGHRETVLTAHRMTRDLDAGPIYLKRPLSLDGTAESILVRASDLAGAMIRELVANRAEPEPQRGEPVVFDQRPPDASMLPSEGTLSQIHDHIRMLDAEGYPPAFLDFGAFRLEFHRSSRYADRVVADVTVRYAGPV